VKRKIGGGGGYAFETKEQPGALEDVRQKEAAQEFVQTEKRKERDWATGFHTNR